MMRINLKENGYNIINVMYETVFTLCVAVIFAFCQEIAQFFQENIGCKFEELIEGLKNYRFIISMCGAILVTFFTYGYITLLKNHTAKKNVISLGNMHLVITLIFMLIWYIIKNILIINNILAYVDICLTLLFSFSVIFSTFLISKVDVENESLNDDYKIA